MLWFTSTFLPRRWALWASIAGLVQFCFANYWTVSYWGGLTAAIAGCLAMGGFWRTLFPNGKSSIWNSVVCGLGLILLMTTRPFEGFIMTGIAFPLMIFRCLKTRTQTIKELFSRFWASGVLVLIGLTVVLLYNYNLTESPFRFPHSEYSGQYFHTSPFGADGKEGFEILPIGQFRSFYDLYLYPYINGYRFYEGLIQKSDRILSFFFFHKVGLLLLAGLPLYLNWKTLFILIPLLSVWITEAFLVPFHPHYMAPLTGCIVLLQCLCFRALFLRLPKYRLNLSIFASILIAVFLVIAIQRITVPTYVNIAYWEFAKNRIQIQKNVAEKSEYACIFVKYKNPGMHHMEWVYNSSRIDQQKVVWAHDLGEMNHELIDYYPKRTFWRLNVSKQGLDLERLNGEGSN